MDEQKEPISEDVKIPATEELQPAPLETAPQEEISTQSPEVEPQKEVEPSEETPQADGEPVTVEVATEPQMEEKAKPAPKTPAPAAEFDWDTYEKGDADEGDRNILTQMYDKTLNTIKEKEVVEGTVISMNKREVVVNIGFKSDGIISLNEFRYNSDLKVGDVVEVYIESQEDKKGQLLLSHKQARTSRSWDRVNAALENDETIKGFVKCRTKGGMIVDVFGIEAFLPGSQIDVKPIRDYDVFVGKTMEFKVVKINHEFKNVVVSHKALIEAELEQQKKEIISKLEKGQVLEGTVKNITNYGVFIDLGGVDGLIHITDLSWGRVAHPEEIVQLDQKLNVVIIDFDNEKKRIALGLKQLTPHPWDALDTNLKIGDKVKGKVVVVADYGAFVEVSPGVEGLIHVSEMSWSQHLRSAQDFLKVGDEVEAVILTLDREERKMSLGIKQLKKDPWETIDEKYAVGSKHSARVRNFTNFGVFVEIEEGVDGLIHISDLSWTRKIKHPSEFTQIGAYLDVVVLEIDKENRRLSLGHKQLEENPWDVFETIFTPDSIHEGTIVEMLDKGAIVALPYGVEGFATPKHLIKEDGSQAKLDEKLLFKVIEFNKDAKRIIVSHSRTHEQEQKNAASEVSEKKKETKKKTKKVVEEQAQTAILEKTTLGDIQQLVDLKDQLSSAETLTEKKAAKKVKAAENVEAPPAEAEAAPEAEIVSETEAVPEVEVAPEVVEVVPETEAVPEAEAAPEVEAVPETKAVPVKKTTKRRKKEETVTAGENEAPVAE